MKQSVYKKFIIDDTSLNFYYFTKGLGVVYFLRV